MRKFLTGTVCVVVALCTTPVANAAALTAEQSTELLARTVAANEKCNVLDSSEAAELVGLMGRSASTLASAKDQDTAAAAVAKGHNIGSTVTCDATTAQAVAGVLKSARMAATVPAPAKPADVVKVAAVTPTALAKKMQPVAKVEVDQPPVRPQRAVARQEKQKPQAKKSVPRKSKTATLKTPKTTNRPNAQLASYGGLAERYYLERRCRTLGSASIAGMYQRVLSAHRATLRTNGVAATARILRAAESRASRLRC
jgi:hypothetical protein